MVYMSVNFNLYHNTINILTDPKPSSDLHFKKLDNTGKLIDVCFLIKLFRIFARCLGFYKNDSVVKELKSAVVKQLTPHLAALKLDLDTAKRPNAFEMMAAKIEATLNPPKDDQPALFPAPPVDTTGSLSPKRATPILSPPLPLMPTSNPVDVPSVTVVDTPPQLTPSEILLQAAKRRFFTEEESKLLLEQEILDLTDWPKPINIIICTPSDSPNVLFPHKNVTCNVVTLLLNCKKLTKVIIKNIDKENIEFLLTILLSKRFEHIQIECPILPLIQSDRLYSTLMTAQIGERCMSEMDNDLPLAVLYYRKYASTPALRAELFEKTFSCDQFLRTDYVLHNIGACLNDLSLEHPQEVVELLHKHIAHFFDGNNYRQEKLIIKLPPLLYPLICSKLLEEEQTQQYFLKFLKIILPVKGCPNLLHVIQNAILKVDRLELLHLLARATGREPDETACISAELDKLLEKMDTAAFNQYMTHHLTSENIDLTLGQFITNIPASKIPLVLTYAASLNAKYHSCTLQSIFTSQQREGYRTCIAPLAALTILALIKEPISPVRNARMSTIYQSLLVQEHTPFATKLAKFIPVDDIAGILNVFANANRPWTQNLSINFFKAIIDLDDPVKTVAAFTHFWPLEKKFHVYTDPKVAKDTFCQIPTFYTLNAILERLKEGNLQTPTGDVDYDHKQSDPNVQNTRLTAWLEALLMKRDFRFYSSPSLSGSYALYEPKLTSEEIHLLLELHPWVLEKFSSATRLRLFEQMIKKTTTDVDQHERDYLNWKTNLKTRPMITAMKAALPDEHLAAVMKNLVFDYWVTPIKH